MSSEDSVSHVDTTRPHSARTYDYLLGGKDNFAVDRQSGDAIRAAMPHVVTAVTENRAFLHRAVRHAAEQGVRQFLDIGTGIPTSPNTHQIAQQVDPAARIVYVDNDPLVLTHARALLTGTPEGRTAYLEADLRHPRTILDSPELGETLDLDQPVALMLVAILHFVRDDENPRGIIDTLVDALPHGSLVIVSHGTGEYMSPEQKEAVAQAAGKSQTQDRNGAQLAALFDRPDLELLEPVHSVSRWWPDEAPQPRPAVEDVACNGLIARVNRP